MHEGLAPKFLELLSIANLQTKKEACVALSSLLTQNQQLIDILIDASIISKLLYIIRAENREVILLSDT